MMKRINNISKLELILFSLLIGLFTSCADDYPENVGSPNEVVLQSIKILNAGADGNVVVEGKVDEINKTVWFPRLDPDTDVSAIRFEAVMSNGAKLDKETYNFEFEEGKDAKTIVIKVMNEPRFREYFVTLRLNVPVFGADFNKAQIYDYSGNDLGNDVYPAFVSNLTRGSSFDGEHVLIVTRAEGGSHRLKMEELKQNVINPIPLNLSNVSGGTFPVNVGSQINGHSYIANLSGLYGMKIYHWINSDAEADIIFNVDPVSIPGAGKRHGDNMSASLDENGNGYFFFGDNAVTGIMRLTVVNFTTITEVKILPTQPDVSFCMSMNRVKDTDDYLLTGYDAPIRVVNSDASLIYEMNKESVPLQGSDARIFTFNEERYMILTTAPRYSGNAVLYVYDITKGGNTVEALQLFEAGDKKPLFQYSIGGSVNSSPGTNTGYKIMKDNEGNDASLLIYTASNNAGFALLEIPAKELDE
ncbi:MAG: DUF4623 domain-containing protein [Proteiniphilum sp.]|nr:DUF4623 domain-containing protein [Proteiniphilum sp.]MDD4157950.1 DUF4623 domain-containing protein [Proteiniphilum sp.]MDD4800719.1 DUF4623 domain-containing protein [Proteiniphilum sp.]